MLRLAGIGSALGGYPLALVAVLVATLLSLIFSDIFERIPFALYFAAVTVTARYAGLGPALTTSLVSVVFVDFLVLPPRFSLAPASPEDAAVLLVLAAVAALISSVTARLRTAEATERRQREWLQTTLASIGDAVIATDDRGRIVQMNAVAERLTGWSTHEADGRPLAEVFQIVDEQTREPAEDPVSRVLRESSAVGLADRTALRARDGAERPIDDSAAPIRGSDGAVTGVVLVFRDVTERRQAETARQQLVSLMESSSEFVGMCDMRMTPIFVNAAGLRMVGLDSLEQARQTPILEFFYPEDRPRITDELLPRVMLDGRGEVEIRFRHFKTGAPIWVIYSVVALADEAGNPTGFGTVTHNITDRKQANEALRASEERLRLATSAARIGHFEIDWTTQTRRWSPELRGMLAVPDDLDINADTGLLARLIVPEHRERYLTRIRGSRDPNGGGDFEDEHEVVRLDGTHAWMLIRGKTLFEDGPDGRYPTRTVGLMMDVTERRQADQALRESEERHRAVWESAADAIALSDPDGTVLAANPAYYDLMDRVPEEVVGRSFAQIFPPEQREQAAEQYRALFASAEHVPLFETSIQRADGSAVPVEARYGFVAQDGRRTGMVSMIRDISERRAMERLQRELLTVIGHELRNPLSSLRGYAQLMKRRQAYSERAVDVIVQQTDRLDRLIRDLTDMSRIESGRLTLEPMPMDLVDLLYACAEQARGQTDGHEIRVEAPDAPIIGVWDRGRLEEVVSNLLSNALKYSPDGGEVTVRVEQYDGTAGVAVHDQGIGIAATQLPQVFDRFYRIRETASTASGLGLGLSICKSLIEAHGGRIWAESDGEGRGSSFHFTLPLAPADGSPEDPVALPRSSTLDQ